MNLFERLLLKKLLSKPAPERIPRSGKAAESVDCYVVYVAPNDETWTFLVQEMNGNGFVGRCWDGSDYSADACMTFDMARVFEYEITHYFGRYEMRYSSLFKFFLGGVLPVDRIKIGFGQVEQFLFNKRSLPRADRIEVLKLLIEHALDHYEQERQVSSVMLVTYLHSQKWVHHPDKDRQLRYSRILLDSLVASGDVNKSNYGYIVQPKALVTIAEYEEERRRHEQNLSQSKNVKWLTFALILVGLIQAFISYYVSSKFGS